MPAVNTITLSSSSAIGEGLYINSVCSRLIYNSIHKLKEIYTLLKYENNPSEFSHSSLSLLYLY